MWLYWLRTSAVKRHNRFCRLYMIIPYYTIISYNIYDILASSCIKISDIFLDNSMKSQRTKLGSTTNLLQVMGSVEQETEDEHGNWRGKGLQR